MPPTKDNLTDLERHVELLEVNAAKVTQSLRHWQLLASEYEALQEEVQAATATASDGQQSEKQATGLMQAQQTELQRIRRDFDGQLVDQATVSEIFGARLGQPITKKAEQIRSVIERRLDYVHQNAATLQKQATVAANRLAAAQVVSRPDMVDEEGGGPITDIVEELDDDDNVVSVQLKTPANTHAHVMEALKKAGIDELGEEEEGGENEKEAKEGGKEKEKEGKKSVSFAEDIKDEDEPAPMSHTARRLDEIMRTAKEQESSFSAATAAAPADESVEDAALRREMLQYSMSEIGPIVAELDIEEGSSDEDWDDDDEEEEEDEDAFGRSKYSVIDEAYRERMRELEEKLGVKPSAGAQATTLTNANRTPEGSVGRIRVAGVDAAPLPGEADKPKKKKSVSFASALDIAEPPEPAEKPTERPAEKPAIPFVEPLSDTVVEHSAAEHSTPKPPAHPKKASRFKRDRTASAADPALPKGPDEAPVRFLDRGHTQRTAPEGPAGKTVADTVVEREVAKTVDEPDELDADLLLQETTTTYHRTRNRLIQRQGGFLHADEAAVVPLAEEEGGPRRVSKFKAARLSRQ